MPRYPITLPDLGLDDVPVTLSVWYVRRGERVAEGEPVACVLAGPVAVDLSAEADGILVERHVGEDEELHAGQTLGVIEAES